MHRDVYPPTIPITPLPRRERAVSLLACERELSRDADRSAQMLVGCLLLALFSGACIAGWLL